MNKQKAFTLIELLVVIAILGLLSSIVLVAVQDVRDKADTAKALQYSASVHHVLGAYIIGEWRFEEGSGGTVSDASGYGNDGTWFGSGEHWDDVNSVPELGTAGKFNGTDDYVRVLDSAILSPDRITVEAWVKLGDTNPGWENSIADKQESGVALGWGLYIGNDTSVYMYIATTGLDKKSIGFGTLDKGKWNHVLFTYDGVSTIRYFKNGLNTVTNTAIASGLIKKTSQPFRIGGYNNFNGLIDEVRIYNEILSSAQIQKLYAQGAKRHNIAYE